jgi:thiol-disulfide isomerase/thioredoxin
VIVQQFAQEQAAAQQIDAGAYIQRLQQDARISFGPAAGALLAAPTLAQPVAAADTATETEPAIAPATTETATETAAAAPLAEQRGVEVGMLAPEFVLATMADDAPSLALSDLRGRPTVLSFWTTWCPYCLRQTPVMVEAYARAAAAGIQFVGIDVQEDRNTVAPYLAQHQIEYPILLDEQGATAAQYAVQGYPTTYFLDSNSRVVARNIGALTGEQLDTYLQMLSLPGQGP